jgi:hypothetical protein
MPNKALHHEDVLESGDTAPRILNHGARWNSLFTYTPSTILPPVSH